MSNNGQDGITVNTAQFLRLLAQGADYYWVEDRDGRCLQCHPHPQRGHDRFCRLLTGNQLASIGLEPLEEASARGKHQQILEQHLAFSDTLFRLPPTDSDSCERFLRVSGSPLFNPEGQFVGYHCIARDISDELEDRRQLQRFRAAMDASMDMMYLVDRESLRFLDVNETACRNSGRTRSELLQMGPSEILGTTEEELTARYDQLIQQGDSSRIESRVQLPGKAPRVVEVHSKAVCIDGRWMIIGVSRDITRRKQAELHNQRLQHMYSALSACNEAILKASSVDGLFRRVCDAVITSGRFIIATVLQPDPDGWLLIKASAGSMSEDIDQVRISIRDDLPEGQGISGQAWRSAASVVSNDVAHDARMQTWENRLRLSHVRSAAAMPLKQRGRQIALLLFYAAEADFFDTEMLQLLRRMRDNVNYALDNFAIEEERRVAEQRTQESEERFRSLTQLTSDFYWEMDSSFNILRYEGRAIGESNQRAIDQLIGKPLWAIETIKPDAQSWDGFRQTLSTESTFRDFEFAFTNDEGQTYHFSLSGEPITDAGGLFAGYRGLSRDITERKRIAEHVQHLATHDSLTGLPNRIMFTQVLNQAIRSARRYPEDAFAVVFVDLDHFKLINDSYGHHTGDLLLQQVARRLREPLRESDLVARLGGDEFVILLPHLWQAEQVQIVANNLLRALHPPIRIGDQECDISASIGFSIYGEDADSAEALLRHADAAMYAAKGEGRNNAQRYADEIHRRTQERVALEGNLRRALQRGELSLHFQAKVALDSQRVVGAEALLRWNSPALGQVSPERFIPIAEENGLILPIGKWVLQQSCRQFRRWREAGLQLETLSVNLSARQLGDPDLTREVQRLLQENGMQAQQLEFEITESTMIRNPGRTISLMQGIRQLGVRFAMDDFGTGYSSLGYLKTYPLDTLKIDRSFVANLANDDTDQAICEAIITLGRTLGLTIVAEGVEDPAQLAFLRQQGCHQAQGFLLHHPTDAERFLQEFGGND